MRALDLMSTPAITCHVNDTLNTAAHLMWNYDCGAVAVVNDEGKLTGIITDRDICMAALTQGRALDAMLVNSAMARHVVSAPPVTPIAALLELMSGNQIRRIPIIDDDKKPIGMVSLNDVALESESPASRMRQGARSVAQALAAICRHRQAQQAA